MIDAFMQQDLRLTKCVVSQGKLATVENIERLEDEKKYQQWLESQQKPDEKKTERLLLAAQKGAVQPGIIDQASYDEKEALFLEIERLMR